MRAITATRAGYVQRGLSRETLGQKRGGRDAAENDPRPSILQLNIEGLTANTISVIELLAFTNKAFIIVLQQTYCTTADKRVIPTSHSLGHSWAETTALPRFFTGGWNRHWSISLQSNQRVSACAWTLQGVRTLTSTNLHARDSHQRPSRHFHTPVCMLATSSANMSTEVTAKHALAVGALNPRQQQTNLGCCMIQRK